MLSKTENFHRNLHSSINKPTKIPKENLCRTTTNVNSQDLPEISEVEIEKAIMDVTGYLRI